MKHSPQDIAETEVIMFGQAVAIRLQEFGYIVHTCSNYDHNKQLRLAWLQVYAEDRRQLSIDEIDSIIGDMVPIEAIDLDVVSNYNGVYVNLPVC